MVDTEKCFKQKLYGSKRGIRRYYWFDFKWRQVKVTSIFFNGTSYF